MCMLTYMYMCTRVMHTCYVLRTPASRSRCVLAGPGSNHAWIKELLTAFGEGKFEMRPAQYRYFSNGDLTARVSSLEIRNHIRGHLEVFSFVYYWDRASDLCLMIPNQTKLVILWMRT